jgi:hypothetical protein
MMKKLFFGVFALILVTAMDLHAQQNAFFAAPKFRKIEKQDLPAFFRKYNTNNLTGRGLQNNVTVDNIPTMEVRARMQAAFGAPSKTVIDMMAEADFRPAKYIQFEYWFEVNDSIPMVILDPNGPFSTGLTYGGLPRFVDIMPEIKREFSKLLMDVQNLGEYSDYYYALDERDKAKGEAIPEGWYLVQYKNGTFGYDRTTAPGRARN